jgi:predicted PurR-regulated permease PerM
MYLAIRAAMRQSARFVPARWVRPTALTGVIVAIVLAAAAASLAVKGHFDPDTRIASLLDLLADTLERLRSTLPDWIASRLPASVADLQHGMAAILRSHAHSLQRWGDQLARGAAHGFIGFVIGLLAGLELPLLSASPWQPVLRRRGRNYVVAFSEIVLAQLRIAAVNTALTAVFLLGVLPLAGIHVPFAGVLVGLTLVTGLLPIVGNLLSNAAIVLAALTVSPGAALAALGFLLVVHKLEYVLNAHFVGRTTRVPAAALLASMVLLEALWGIAGLILAPIACAWAFHEARDAGIL